MGTLTEASFLAATGRRYGCRIADVLRNLDDKDRATLEKVLTARNRNGDAYLVSHRAVADVLTAAGHKITRSSVEIHRRHECPG